MDNYTEKQPKTQEEKTVLDKCTDKKLKNPKFSNYIEPVSYTHLTLPTTSRV